MICLINILVSYGRPHTHVPIPTHLEEHVPILFGAILIVVLRFLPGGFITIPERIRFLIQRR